MAAFDAPYGRAVLALGAPRLRPRREGRALTLEEVGTMIAATRRRLRQMAGHARWQTRRAIGAPSRMLWPAEHAWPAAGPGPTPVPALGAQPPEETPMIKASILKALNKQIQHEQSNAYAYQAVSLYFGRQHLHGLEAFMAQQVEDERMHAAKFIRHVTDRGGRVDLGALAAPPTEFASPLEAAKAVRDLEHATTGTIHALHLLASNESDCALEALLDWFIAEQVEEEQWSEELAALMEQFHGHPGQVFMLDHQWGKRARPKLS